MQGLALGREAFISVRLLLVQSPLRRKTALDLFITAEVTASTIQARSSSLLGILLMECNICLLYYK
jgi:hypothetical protein